MRKLTALLICLMVGLFSLPTVAADRIDHLRDLYDTKRFFNLRNSVNQIDNSDDPRLHFYQGVVLNKFNRPDASIEHLQQYLAQTESIDSTLRAEVYFLLADNHFKAFSYASAEDAYGTLIENYSFILDSAQLDDARNMRKIARGLREVPPQTTRIADGFEIELAGGMVPLQINGQDHDLAFDTGANLSVLMRSLAEQLGLRQIKAGIEVSTITGNRIIADLGVADSIRIGQALIRNTVFVVLDDSALYIPQADFQIEGVIGYPVISSLRQITFDGLETLRVPAEPDECARGNLGIDGFTPLMAGTFRGTRCIFAYDTGANKTFFYKPFFRAFSEYLSPRCVSDTEMVVGVGGHRKIPACRVDSIQLVLAGETVVLDSAVILEEKSVEDSEYYFGNIGRDATARFQSITINFDSMCIWFE